jgi:hypothetical protein
MKSGSTLAAFLLAAASATSASASTVVLNFAGLDGNNQELVQNFYNGGAGGLGSTGGPNYGIAFSNNAIACSGQPGGSCNSAAIPGGPGANLLFFLGGGAAIMDVDLGFNTGFSLFYSAAFNPGSVSVFSGLGGTGSVLASIDLPLTIDGSGTAGCFGTNFCPYSPVGVTFLGTARSVAFAGANNQIAFANVTFGSDRPGGTIPEPASLALVGLGLLGLAGSRKRKAV